MALGYSIVQLDLELTQGKTPTMGKRNISDLTVQ